AKQQAEAEGLAFTELANGFSTCSHPARLQAICDRLGPEQIQAFFDRWMDVIPTPLGLPERERGYWWELSMRQVEVSRTLVFDAPRRARGLEGEHCVGRSVATGRTVQGCGALKRFLLDGEVGVEVDLSGGDELVPEPEGDGCDVDAALQQPHGAGVPQDVRRDPLGSQRRAGELGSPGVLEDQGLDRVGGQRLTAHAWEDGLARMSTHP